MKKKTNKIKKWKELSINEQNGFYYIFKGYSKMTSSYDIPKEYQKECEKREKKENKEEEKERWGLYEYGQKQNNKRRF